MKREVLFRAYQKNFKRMLPVVGIEFDANGVQVVTVDNRGMDGKYDVIPYYSRYIDGDEDFPLDTLILMQSTGLRDKNGTKIFEGDILKDVVVGTVFAVFFVGGGFIVESNPTHFGYGHQKGVNPTESLSNPEMRSCVEDNFEVIGNIYDKEDLLK